MYVGNINSKYCKNIQQYTKISDSLNKKDEYSYYYCVIPITSFGQPRSLHYLG